MQPLSGPERSEEDTVYVIRDAPSVTMRAGLELLDSDLNVVEDLSDYLQDCTVSRGANNEIHGTARLKLTNPLSWGSAIVRPYMVLDSDGRTARFNLGAYYTSVPRYTTGQDTITYDVDCIDVLDILNTPVGESFGVSAGADTILSVVENILQNLGVTRYAIDATKSDVIPTTSTAWPMADATTWLVVVNDLLAMVGYRGIYSNWDGVLVCESYINPVDRAPEWEYTDDEVTSMHRPEIGVEQDVYGMPNRWVFINGAFNDGTDQPVEGAGVFIYQNDTIGVGSVDARGGRVITRLETIDASSQEDLEASAMRSINSQMSVLLKYAVETGPNPLHWHFDVISFTDGAVNGGTTTRLLETDWSLNLTEGSMAHAWTEIGGS